MDIKRRKARWAQKQSGVVNVDGSSAVFGGINQQQLASFTESVVTYTVLAAYTVGCIQFGPNKNSEGYVRGSAPKRLCHYVVTMLLFVSLLHKFEASVLKFGESGRPSVET